MLKQRIRWKSGQGIGFSALVFSVLSVALSVGSLKGASAEEIGISTTTPPPNPRVRTVTRPQATPMARPQAPATRPQTATRPRPIQDETTPATSPQQMQSSGQLSGTGTSPGQSSRAQTSPSQTLAPGANSSAPPRAVPRRGQEQAVDLSALSTGTSSSGGSSAASGRSTTTAGMSPHQSSGLVPNFKFYFDFLLRSWKGTPSQGTLTFEGYHQRMLVEYTPSPDLMFQADISSWQSPKYYEVDYMLTRSLQIRWGRIWIPFDDMSPHSIFGGRMNTSEFFQPNETAFLPDIWADMGMGLKIILADSSKFSSDFHAYAVNGFQSGGTSPVQGEGGVIEYPDFAGTTGASSDNNNNKAMGARWHSVFGQRFGIGGSFYTGAYTPKSVPDSKTITMLGGDIQLMPTNTTQIRFGIVSMKVGLYSPPATPIAKDSFSRGGSYVELGQKFGAENRWKFLIRAGKSQNDNRVVDVSDKTLVGATLLRNFGAVEAQLTFFKDMNTVAAKSAYNYGAFRLVTAL
jgi:hypothetical protein